MAEQTTPRAAKLLLAAVLAATLGAVAWSLGGGRGDEPQATGLVLLLLTVLFLLRVAGQIAVALVAPAWLPPMSHWNLLAYRFLLPIQAVFLAAMGLVVADLLRGTGDGPFSTRRPAVGAAVVALSAVYAAAMAVRYAVRMRRRPAQRWFGGTIPIVFHCVLSAFLAVYGVYSLRAA